VNLKETVTAEKIEAKPKKIDALKVTACSHWCFTNLSCDRNELEERMRYFEYSQGGRPADPMFWLFLGCFNRSRSLAPLNDSDT
jgi:hypothetical protein